MHAACFSLVFVAKGMRFLDVISAVMVFTLVFSRLNPWVFEMNGEIALLLSDLDPLALPLRFSAAHAFMFDVLCN